MVADSCDRIRCRTPRMHRNRLVAVDSTAREDLRKPGCGLDLPIALAILIAEGAIPPDALADLLVLGELG